MKPSDKIYEHNFDNLQEWFDFVEWDDNTPGYENFSQSRRASQDAEESDQGWTPKEVFGAEDERKLSIAVRGIWVE